MINNGNELNPGTDNSQQRFTFSMHKMCKERAPGAGEPSLALLRSTVQVLHCKSQQGA